MAEAAFPPRDQPIRRVDPADLRALMVGLLRAAGCPEDIAEIAAEIHWEADLRGHHIQGLDHMTELVGNIRAGRIDPEGRPEVVRDGPAWAQLSGHNGLGHPAGLLAAATAAEKAGGAGIAVIGVKDSADIFLVGYYAEMIARAGFAAVITTNVPPHVHPFGGAGAVLGTNPIAFAFPTAGENPLVFDMATSVVAASHIRQAAYDGIPIPAGIGVGPDGKPSTDARTVEKGSIGSMAGHRGSGLALCLGLLSGPLVGAATGKALDSWLGRDVAHKGLGHFMLAVDPGIFGDAEDFRAAVEAHLAEIRGARRAEGVERVLVPGDRLFETRARSLAEGVDMHESVWREAAKLAVSLGVEMPG
ncbi:MAG: Ldh family oxidoreductase [Rhodospirillaceae bacterium]|jgi:LDH2 family malate/lactate/ureidoglycolate dehydrogenase|nr:Ldh family oxidoreductase [Rhodospirillaceae bacterium]